MQRPTFNVTEFQDVVNVQMNDAMRHMLIEFISEVEPNELEAELRAFRNALRDPEGALERKLKSTSTSRRRSGGYREDYVTRPPAPGLTHRNYRDQPQADYRDQPEHNDE